MRLAPYTDRQLEAYSIDKALRASIKFEKKKKYIYQVV
jgi:hypothetical protein